MTERTKVHMPPLLVLKEQGVLIPTKELIVAINREIITYRQTFGRNDPHAFRYDGEIDHLIYLLTEYPYSSNPRENAFSIATECFYAIACRHPFAEGNKSTGYMCALILLYSNLIVKGSFVLKKEHMLEAPAEVIEIVKLADSSSKAEDEVKRLIKDFLLKHV